MKKTLALIMVLVLVAAMAACGAEPKNIGDKMLFTEDEISQVNEDNTEGFINGEKADTDMIKDMEAMLSGGTVEGLPDGFPQSVPLYDGAQLIEADTYGDNGFTVVYAVNAPYESVVAFYMTAIAGMDESGIGEDEAYFEGVALDDGVYINGLTVSDADGSTQVFITLKAETSDAGYDEASSDDSYEYEETDGGDLIEVDYDSVTGNNLEDGYPLNVVPLYDAFKIVDSSKTPSNDLYMLDGITPPNSYDDVVAFYSSALGISSESFDSQMMKTDDFSGEKDGWSYSVYVGVMKAGGNVMINITMQK